MIIVINVGGKLFTTTKETLLESNYFQDILDGKIICEKDDYGNIFVDRCPKIFGQVLNFLRDDKYKFPNEYLFELDHYRIPYSHPEDDFVECKKCKFRKVDPKYVYCDFCVRGMMQA